MLATNMSVYACDMVIVYDPRMILNPCWLYKSSIGFLVLHSSLLGVTKDMGLDDLAGTSLQGFPYHLGHF